MLAVGFDEFLRYLLCDLEHFPTGRGFDYQTGEILGSSQPDAFGEVLNPNTDRVLVLALTHYPKGLPAHDRFSMDAHWGLLTGRA